MLRRKSRLPVVMPATLYITHPTSILHLSHKPELQSAVTGLRQRTTPHNRSLHNDIIHANQGTRRYFAFHFSLRGDAPNRAAYLHPTSETATLPTISSVRALILSTVSAVVCQYSGNGNWMTSMTRRPASNNGMWSSVTARPV